MTRIKTGVAAVLLAGSVALTFAETAALYENNDTVVGRIGDTNFPMIDAIAFANYGTFDVQTTSPFQMSNTQNVTNRGTMLGSVGYRFDYYPFSGTRRRSMSFVNEGEIVAKPLPSASLVLGEPLYGIGFPPYAYIEIDSTELRSPGLLNAGAYGRVRMFGNNVDLRNAPVMAAMSPQEVGGIGGFDSIFSSNYINENKMVDDYWGLGLQLVDLPYQFGTNKIETGNFFADTYGYQWVYTNLVLTNFVSFAFTNQTSTTNRSIQVVFISTNAMETNLGVDVRFRPISSRGSHAMVQFQSVATDVVTGLPYTNFLYLSDNSIRATSGTNFFMQTNSVTPSYRPNSFDLSELTPSEWLSPSAYPSNALYASSLLYGPSYLRDYAVGDYAVYAIDVGVSGAITNGNLVYDQDYTRYIAAQLDPTNSLGRVEVYADRLDIDRARLRSDGLLTLVATNFVIPPNGAKLDASEVSINLTVTNSCFPLSNILAGNVIRICGKLKLWSGVWTNETAAGHDDFHVLMVDSQLRSVRSSKAYGFTLRATNQPGSHIVIEDDVDVARNFLIDAEKLTVRGQMLLPKSIGYANLPRLTCFTNEGDIRIEAGALFSRQNNGAYDAFVNKSNLSAAGVFVLSRYFENSGNLQALGGAITVSNNAGAAWLMGCGNTNSQILSYNDFKLSSGMLTTSNSWIFAGSAMTNYVNGAVTYSAGAIILSLDTGMTNHASNDVWIANNGFQLRKNTPGSWTGGLMGTRLISQPRPFFRAQHVWTADDRGADRAGFTDNAAVGILTLDGGATGLFRFSAHSPATNSAIYVDYLEFLNNATNLISALEVDPNFTIYFANSGPIPPSKLDGRLGGRLRWVKNFAGPNSSTNVFLRTGGTITVNRALVEDDQIDSDGDGIVNNIDPFPFDGPALTSSLTTPPWQFALQWNAASNTTYFVDVATNLSAANPWTRLTNVAVGGIAGSVTVWDLPPEGGQRYYRVLFVP